MSDKVSDERLVEALLTWLRKRSEPDSGIRYEGAGYRGENNAYRHASVQLHGPDADFVAEHFHGRGALDLADALAARINSAIEPAAVADGYVMVPALTAYQAQVLIGTTISGCTMQPDRVFDLKRAWVDLHGLGLIDRTDGLAFATEAGANLVRAMLAARPISASGRDGE